MFINTGMFILNFEQLLTGDEIKLMRDKAK